MECLRVISDVLGCGLLIFDETMRVSHANQRAGKILGLPLQDLLCKPMADIDAMLRNSQGKVLPAEDKPLERCRLRKEQLSDEEVWVQQSSGALVAISLNAAPLHHENGQLVGMVADFQKRHQSEERLRNFIGAMDEIAFEFNEDGCYLNVWTENEELLKVPREKLLGRCLDEFIPKEMARKMHAIIRRVRQTGKPETLEYPLDVISGTRWFLARVALVPPQPGGEPTFSFLARDISEKKQLEFNLLESERRFRGLFENAAIGIALIGLDGRCLEANQHLRNLLGYSLEEMRNKSIASCSHTEDHLVEQREFERMLRGEIDFYRWEKRFIRKGGTELWGHLTLALQRNERGTPLYCIAILEDVTPRKMAEEEKNNLLGELEAIFSAAADGIIFYDEHGNIRRMNKAAEEITGYSEKEKRQTFAERYQLWGPRRQDGSLVSLEEVGIRGLFKGEANKHRMVPFRRPDGRQVWVSFSVSPIFDATGLQSGAVTTITDLTEVRELQERLKDYIHMLAHDLRAPLTIISGHAQLLESFLKETELAETSRESVESILGSVGQMKQMMEDLVEIGRLGSGQIVRHFDVISLRSFLEKFLRHQVGPEYRRVRNNIPEDLPAVRIGASHLERCIENLIGNALKYSETTQPVDLEASSENDCVCLAVQDYGKGIPEEEQAQIFDRFYRTARAKENTSGTGMGLYITRSLIEIYGGTIQVQSAPGEGTRFIVCLPTIPREDDC